MKFWKRLTVIGLSIVILMIFSIGAWATWQRMRDPLAALNYEIEKVRVSEDNTYTVNINRNDKRIYHDMTLSAGNMENIRITVSLPKKIPPNGLPVVLILGGVELESGRDTLKYIPNHGRNALVTYEYPYKVEYWNKNTNFLEIITIRQAMLIVPAQVTTVAKWVKSQKWTDKNRLCIVGYSLGALFVPAIYRLATANGLSLNPSVMAYGGADLSLILRANLHFIPEKLRPSVSWLAATAVHPLEPALHLPYLQSDVLFINSNHDKRIPPVCVQQMHALKPEPKTVITLAADHLHPDRPELTTHVIRTTQQWLLERSAIEL